MAGEKVIIFASTLKDANAAQNIVWQMEDAYNLPRTAFNMSVQEMAETSADSKDGEERLRVAFKLLGAEFEESTEEQLDNWLGKAFGLSRPETYPK